MINTRDISRYKPFSFPPPSMIPAAILLAAGIMLTACGRGSSSGPAPSSMEISEVTLTSEEQELVSLLDTHSNSWIYEYKTGSEMKELLFHIEEFKDGTLTSIAGAGGPALQEGKFSILMDPDEITVSWDGGRYSCLVDTTSGYKSSVTSHLGALSSFEYNEPVSIAMVASTQSDSIASAGVTDYYNLPELQERGYDRVLFITVSFTDTDSNGTDSAGIKDGRTDSADTKDEFSSRLLMAGGKLYYGTSEIGPMGDAGSVDGHITASLKPEETPDTEGQSNFDCIGNPYTLDFGDGMIMVLSDDKEWHIFRAEETHGVSGTFCAFIKRLDGDRLYVDIAEWITPEDMERVRELSLSEQDMPDGYYIYNPSRSQTILTLTGKTLYRFIDWGRDFVSSDDMKELLIETTDKEKFVRYLGTYEDSTPGMPFFIDVENGIVSMIEEKPIA
ncbi:hypothetical protein [uncultured Clostridium sp.]|uniref:hypothetical protein n=1 Tax=uncultured Clostridium sp. TaxID=59620 RepID=UPI0025F13EF5|nr:hypothetical protein [uncultured Clostridium sp.]